MPSSNVASRASSVLAGTGCSKLSARETWSRPLGASLREQAVSAVVAVGVTAGRWRPP
ncbi:MAG: hypothetical protein HY721_12930 [Planctomycetes bacterium]|nr:hypothetical protein [Planctomycetota bacterium]